MPIKGTNTDIYCSTIHAKHLLSPIIINPASIISSLSDIQSSQEATTRLFRGSLVCHPEKRFVTITGSPLQTGRSWNFVHCTAPPCECSASELYYFVPHQIAWLARPFVQPAIYPVYVQPIFDKLIINVQIFEGRGFRGCFAFHEIFILENNEY